MTTVQIIVVAFGAWLLGLTVWNFKKIMPLGPLLMLGTLLGVAACLVLGAAVWNAPEIDETLQWVAFAVASLSIVIAVIAYMPYANGSKTPPKD